MTEIRNYAYTSILAPYIEGFIAEKRSLGFIYNSEAYELFRLDAYSAGVSAPQGCWQSI